MTSAIILLVVLVAVILILQRFGVPDNIIGIMWIVLVALVAIWAIKFLVGGAL